MQVRVFSPRRKPITTEVGAGETFGGIRTRLGKELGIAGERGLILHRGETVKDDEPASSRLQGSEEVVTLSRDKTLLFHTAMPRRLTGEASPEVSSSAVLRADTLCRQVLFFMEITDPPKRARASRNAFAGPGMFGMPGGRGGGMLPGNPAAAGLAAQLMQRMQQAQQQARQPAQGGSAQRSTQPQQQPPPTQQPQNAMAQELVKQLTEMGFSKVRALAALRNSSFDLIDALQWLEEHADDPDSMFEGAGRSGRAAGAAPVSAPAAPSGAAASAPVRQEPSAQVLQMMPLFEPVIRAIALVANGNKRAQTVLDTVRLPAMESDGWKGFHAAVRRIWAGERNAEALAVGLDANTTFFIQKVLEFTAFGLDTLVSQADDDTWSAMPKDPEFDAVLQQLHPMLQRMAKFAVASTQHAFGQGGMLDESEEAQLNAFIEKMEAAQYQLKTGWEMVCAGVRETGDVIECVAPLANGKPDDKSNRLLRTLVQLIAQAEAQ